MVEFPIKQTLLVVAFVLFPIIVAVLLYFLRRPRSRSLSSKVLEEEEQTEEKIEQIQTKRVEKLKELDQEYEKDLQKLQTAQDDEQRRLKEEYKSLKGEEWDQLMEEEAAKLDAFLNKRRNGS